MKIERILGFVRLIRPINCLMMGLAVIVGAFISMRTYTFNYEVIVKLVLGFVTAFTLTGASMAINDYYDREIDAINEPTRPIPSGIVKPKESIILTAVLTAIGLLSATMTNIMCILMASVSWIISLTYSTVGKSTGLPGNLLVSTCISLPFIYGGAVLMGNIEYTTILFAALAFLANTGREITKGIVDIEGDRTKGIKTIAISWGPRRAAQVASAFFILAVLLSPLPMVLKLTGTWFLPPLIIADIGFITSSISLIRKQTKENAKKIKNKALIWMLLGLIAFISGTIK
ncbi:MAG: geranylgeranylglycerol-phosphate geranylgeranyltransferase [Nitrososphaerota archaeon]